MMHQSAFQFEQNVLVFGEIKISEWNKLHRLYNSVEFFNLHLIIPCQAMPSDAVSLTNYLKGVSEQTESSINLILTTTESWMKMSSSGDVWTMRILLSC